MKKTIAILVLLLLVGGGVVAAWWYFLKPQDNAPVAAEPVYSRLELETIPVTRIRNGRAEQLFHFQIVLLMDDRKKVEKIRRVMPAITDSIIMELHWLLPRKIMEQNGFDQELIRSRLEKAVTKRVGPGWVHRLNIRNMDRMELR